MRRLSHGTKESADERDTDESFQCVAEIGREMYEVHALFVRAHLAAGLEIITLGNDRGQLLIDEEFAADAQVDFEYARIEFDRGRGGLQRMRGQTPYDDRGGAFDLPVSFAYSDTCQVADDEVHRFRIALGLEQVAEERQHVVELPAGEAVIRRVQAGVVEVFRVNLVAARNGTAEFPGSLFSA